MRQVREGERIIAAGRRRIVVGGRAWEVEKLETQPKTDHSIDLGPGLRRHFPLLEDKEKMAGYIGIAIYAGCVVVGVALLALMSSVK